MIKNVKILLMFIACVVHALAFAQAGGMPDEVRTRQLFNFGWKFHPGDAAQAQRPDFDDKAWRRLDLPHDFQIEQPWDQKANRSLGFKAPGLGWYRKTFRADPAWKGRQVLLDFEGILMAGEVWVNGKKVGGTHYGYLGFEANIADVLDYGGDNVVAVRASNKDGNSRWYTGGGLFRDIHLVVKAPISIARHGVFVTTPAISESNADINVQVEVAGLKEKTDAIEIRARIFGPDGKQVGATRGMVPPVRNLAEIEVPLPTVGVAAPRLWSTEAPAMYAAEVELLAGGRVIDRVSKRFGIRSIEFSKEFGLKLNGKKIFLRGVANHHDLGAVGAAAYRTSIARMMDRLKSFGFNHIRTSHNPYSESFLELADEKGILVVDELYDKWGSTRAWAGSAPWNDLWFGNLKEWIKRDRNHPSVIMWSFGNELQFQEERWGFPTGDWGKTTYRIMDVVAKRYDPTRKTTVAMYPARANGIIKANPAFNIQENIVPPELATITEVASFNYTWVDYQQYLKHAPNMIIYQSEAVTNELAAPYFGMDRDKMVGLAYWGAIEYWGESDGWPKKGWAYSFFNHALEPFPQAWLMQSIFKPEPLVHIGVVDNEGESKLWNDVMVGQKVVSSHWNRQQGKSYNLYTYTNADEVELLVNGKSIGVQRNPTEVTRRNTIYWKDVPYAPGTITALARTAGKVVAQHQLETTGKAVALKIEVENPHWKADGLDLQYVRVYAVDAKGRKVPTTGGEVSFEVRGAARLIAVDNGNHWSDDLFAGNKKKLHNGFAMAILRAEQRAGTVRLSVTAPGLQGAQQSFEVR
ncbi:beta-galactosidase [Duganella sp. CF517]|uniref:glycoside hydrolase family 2 TIM barrel-domain containing protein n=1 Tax=Duganella sp. CF517 TaxID=1881038 RepID=UPI0008D742E7|nr:glycoside hydrolase family 2 TIM barrel-domain containing protein [Duganella sp. CF517]SEN10208.1 beta-galactosidase [Duganella sp. CF517]